MLPDQFAEGFDGLSIGNNDLTQLVLGVGRDFAAFAAFLVEEGIDSISLNPDSVVEALKKITETEARLSRTGQAAAS